MASILNYLQVIIGLGVVIFVHELGHFLLAKMNGVKVEKFSIGFGTPLVAWRRGVGLRFLSSTPIPEPVAANKPAAAGTEEIEPSLTPAPTVGETEYALAAIPLGGFVKMLGETPEEARESTDPRAFPNKSVWARMAIISAGVIMNVIFGLLCFAYAYRMGLTEIPGIVGSVSPGSPAYLAGIQPGDEIVSIDGKGPIAFDDLLFKSALSGNGQKLRMELRSPGAETTRVVDVEPKTEANSLMPRVGIGPALGTGIYEKEPLAPPAGFPLPAPKITARAGDQIVAVGPVDGPSEPVSGPIELDRLLAKYRNVPLRFTVRNTGIDAKDKDATATPTEHTFDLPPCMFVDLGLRMTLGPVVAVQKDRPGALAGLRDGDVIVQVAGRSDFDPIRLPEEFADRAGQPVEIVVQRSVPGTQPARTETVTLTVTPDNRPPGIDSYLDPSAPTDIPSLGVAATILPKVAAVRPDSAAAAAGLKEGETIRSVKVIPPKPGTPDTFSFEDKKKPTNWAYLFFRSLQSRPGTKLEVKLNGSDKDYTLAPTPSADWYNPDRGLQLLIMQRDLPPQDFGSAMSRGVEDIRRNAMSVLFMIRGLVQGRLSRKVVSGPIGIFQIGSSAADKGFIDLVRFLGMLSINLAVINFLPIPPLDGGQMVFLIGEKIRGRPLPEGMVGPITILGLVFVLCLMVFVLFQDISKVIAKLFE